MQARAHRLAARADRARLIAAGSCLLASLVSGAPRANTSWVELVPHEIAVWSADHETGIDGESGGLSQWKDGDSLAPGGGIFNTGEEDVEVFADDGLAHSGAYSVRMTIRGAEAGNARAVRLMRWRDGAWETPGTDYLPRQAYYSAWYYIPRFYAPAVWWNIFQFKASEPDFPEQSRTMFALNVFPDSPLPGQMELYLYSNANPPYSFDQVDPIPLPIGEWVHIEIYYRVALDNRGAIAVWQDGRQIIAAGGVTTSLGTTEVWGIGNYTDDIDPSTATIWIDDAAVATDRIYPHIGPSTPNIEFLADKRTLSWHAEPWARAYDVYRGVLADLRDADADGLPDRGYGYCQNYRDGDTGDTVFATVDEPVGHQQGYFYLVAGVGPGGRGNLGFGRDWARREGATACTHGGDGPRPVIEYDQDDEFDEADVRP